ncbi:hypothetical protein C241_26425 [Bradyrhizobium lupini HPC(L)]|jgi:hypothetical protein|uniref:Uncharacterized protein n=1 Tax=Bradyrhizobium lupini HPC(L) TaxID=1229491 RepID=A0ABN0HF75_RHILU|nr:hypothetical protein [Agrobacterium pusense]EKJ93191.1 hypothetical protein C241_26425 [Bradyrhizobium lupini HPC(L)]TGR67855.1 hypothetical protein EN837_14385 [bacterium M00.F.Ca.ET.194.01.1.1]TGS53957.1 hypothetical protein EN822_14380 [bacterium M00.F.Ca.ET.179.01.1.1]TGV46772.1 hypothetical protein EN811_14385 [bacterium M00.F.Ca.ET.168.01.1.1]
MSNEVVSLLAIRKVLNEFCEDNRLPIGCAMAVDAARYLIGIASTGEVGRLTLRLSLDQWMKERIAAAA